MTPLYEIIVATSQRAARQIVTIAGQALQERVVIWNVKAPQIESGDIVAVNYWRV